MLTYIVYFLDEIQSLVKHGQMIQEFEGQITLNRQTDATSYPISLKYTPYKLIQDSTRELLTKTPETEI